MGLSTHHNVLLLRGLTAGVLAALAVGAACRVLLPLLPNAWVVWLVAEAVFLVWFKTCHAPRLAAQPLVHAPDHVDPILHFKRLVSHAKFYEESCGHSLCWDSYLSKWFKNTPTSNISVGNLKEMLGYSFMYSTREALEADGRWPLVEAMVEKLNQLAAPPTGADASKQPQAAKGKVTLSEGYQSGVSFMAHLWEPLQYWYRPLWFYVGVEVIHWLSWVVLLAMGLRSFRLDGSTYYYTHGRPGCQPAGAPPLLFIHGVGLGLTPYLLVLSRLLATGRPLLCPELRHVSMRLTRHVPTACEVAAKITRAMNSLHMQQACVVAHSYGTFVASRLVQLHPDRVASLALIDPVCFCMWLPSLLQNFIYRTPLEAYRQGGWGKAFKYAFVWLIARDVHTAATFCRKFYWTDVNLWAEELPRRTLVVLASADDLLHADEVRFVVTGRYKGVQRPSQPFTHEQLITWGDAGSAPSCSPAVESRVLYHPSAGHADFLGDTTWQAEIVEQVLSLATADTAQLAADASSVRTIKDETQAAQPEARQATLKAISVAALVELQDQAATQDSTTKGVKHLVDRRFTFPTPVSKVSKASTSLNAASCRVTPQHPPCSTLAVSPSADLCFLPISTALAL